VIYNTNDVYNKLKRDIKSKTDWKVNGTNAIGFNALPAGYLDSDGYFSGKGNGTYFWTSICCVAFDSSASALQIDEYACSIGTNQPKKSCYSVRCIKE
jgi:uncharacterized protein (TIGR02145 family)